MVKITDPVVQEQVAFARRHQILDAAAKVFAERGFHPTTIRDVAREAGIADGTIYNYFENKSALLIGIFDRMREAVQPRIDPAEVLAMDVRQFLATFLRLPMMALHQNNFALFRVVMSEMMVNPELRTLYLEGMLQPTLLMVEPLLQHWAAQGLIRTPDVALTLRVVSSLLLGLMLEHTIGDEALQARWEELPDFVADLLLNGIQGENQ